MDIFFYFFFRINLVFLKIGWSERIRMCDFFFKNFLENYAIKVRYVILIG